MMRGTHLLLCASAALAFNGPLLPPCYEASAVTVTKGIPFGKAFNHFTKQMQTLLLDRYSPPVHDASVRPAFVLVHGGAFVSGNRTSDGEPQLAMELARRGFLVVSIEYRLEGQAFGADTFCCPGNASEQYAIDAVHDAKAAVRFLRKQAADDEWRVDAARIGVGGDSAGAVTSLYFYAPDVGEGLSGNPGYNSSVRVVMPISGELEYDAWCQGFLPSGEPYGCVKGISSMDRIDDLRGGGQPPLAMVHGTDDLIVPYREALHNQKRAKSVGLPVKLITIQGGGHVPMQQLLQSHLDELLAFVDVAMDIQGPRPPCSPLPFEPVPLAYVDEL